MSDARLVRISKLMSLILRHKPEQFGVILDGEGYAPIDDVVRGIRGGRHGKPTVLEVKALRASEAGLIFYRANESFWLADFIPPAFIRR